MRLEKICFRYESTLISVNIMKYGPAFVAFVGCTQQSFHWHVPVVRTIEGSKINTMPIYSNAAGQNYSMLTYRNAFQHFVSGLHSPKSHILQHIGVESFLVPYDVIVFTKWSTYFLYKNEEVIFEKIMSYDTGKTTFLLPVENMHSTLYELQYRARFMLWMHLRVIFERFVGSGLDNNTKHFHSCSRRKVF